MGEARRKSQYAFMNLHVSTENISGREFSHHLGNGNEIAELQGFLRAVLYFSTPGYFSSVFQHTRGSDSSLNRSQLRLCKV